MKPHLMRSGASVGLRWLALAVYRNDDGTPWRPLYVGPLRKPGWLPGFGDTPAAAVADFRARNRC
jgi:hypothetical protein